MIALIRRARGEDISRLTTRCAERWPRSAGVISAGMKRPDSGRWTEAMADDEKRETRANTASARHVRIAPRKARMVIDLVRGKPILEALDILQFTQKRAAPLISKVVESALRNVEESDELDWDLDDLYVSEAYVNEGPTLKRFKPRAMGRATTILKRTSHINIELEPRDDE